MIETYVFTNFKRKIQDETLRKRLLELELESKELKKQERQKKLLQTEESENRTTRSRKVSQKRFPSQSPNNLVRKCVCICSEILF